MRINTHRYYLRSVTRAELMGKQASDIETLFPKLARSFNLNKGASHTTCTPATSALCAQIYASFIL